MECGNDGDQSNLDALCIWYEVLLDSNKKVIQSELKGIIVSSHGFHPCQTYLRGQDKRDSRCLDRPIKVVRGAGLLITLAQTQRNTFTVVSTLIRFTKNSARHHYTIKSRQKEVWNTREGAEQLGVSYI